MSTTESIEKPFFKAIQHHQSESLVEILSRNECLMTDMLDEGLFLFVNGIKNSEFETANHQDLSYLAKYDIIYMLLDSGANIDKTDKNGNSVLYYAALNRNHELCDVLLQCGADMWLLTEHGISIYEFVSASDSASVIEVFNKYHPGLWKAVQFEDIYQVRQLINYWCRTNLQKDGVSLKDIALISGNEEIINLILGVFESMELVYHILANNVKAVKTKLETCKKRLRLNLRKMSDHGAPILYYLIQTRNVPIIQLFIQHDCQIYTIMQDDMKNDLPVLFSSLTPDMPANVIDALVPSGKAQLEEILYKILYKGKTVLEIAIENGVSKDVFQLLVDRGGPLLLCDRNQFNKTVQDTAISLDQHLYSSTIDESVYNWIAYPEKYPRRREKLVLLGWKFNWSQYKKNENLDKNILEFFDESDYIQARINELNMAIEVGNVSKLMELRHAEYFNFHWAELLWHGRAMGDGIPLLHRAVLHNRVEIVEVILNEKPLKESIDNLFDQHHRTALHYAFASSLFKKIQKLLLMSGCSEHVLDKNNKEPLDFRDKQDSPMLMKLLERIKLKNFSANEPDVWVTGTEGCDSFKDKLVLNEGTYNQHVSTTDRCFNLKLPKRSNPEVEDNFSECEYSDTESSCDAVNNKKRFQCVIL